MAVNLSRGPIPIEQTLLPYLLQKILILFMLPDYPHKIFADKRKHFELLMETLAMEAGLAE